MSRFMVQAVRFRFLVVALLVIGAAEPGALAQGGGGGGTGGGTVYFEASQPGANLTWSMNSDGTNKTLLGNWVSHRVPSRDLHNGYRWYLTTLTIPDSYYPDGTTPRSEVFAFREDYDYNNPDTIVQLTNDATLQPFFPWNRFVEWLPGDQTISFKARRWQGSTPVDGGLYTADLLFRADGNIIGLAALPTTPTLAFPLDGNWMPILGTHSWDDTGTRVVYNDDSSTGSTGLWVADLSSGARTQIFWGLARDPDWSPDGTKIAMHFGHSIHTIKPNGKGLKRIISPTYVDGVYCDSFGKPYFSPTGSHIVFIGWAEYPGAFNNEVFRATVTGRYLTNLTESLGIHEFPLGWRDSPPLPPAPGITVTPTLGLATTEAGGSDVFSVVLNTEPTAAVTIDLSTSDVTEGLVSAGAQGPAASVWLSFDATNWNVAQTVTVNGVDDAIVDGDIAYAVVTAPAVSGDQGYNGLDADDVSVTNLDDDGVGVTVLSIFPDSMPAGSNMAVTITGSGFQPGATVTFLNGSGPAPTADITDVSLDGFTIEATITAPGGGKRGTRVWDVRVTNPGASTGTLTGEFTVIR